MFKQSYSEILLTLAKAIQPHKNSKLRFYNSPRWYIITKHLIP